MELVFLWIVFGIVGYFIGRTRGLDMQGFWWGLLLGPIGWLVVLMMGHAMPMQAAPAVAAEAPPRRSSGGPVTLIIMAIVAIIAGAAWLYQDNPGMRAWRSDLQAWNQKMDDLGVYERRMQSTPMIAADRLQTLNEIIKLRQDAEHELNAILRRKPIPLTAEEMATLKRTDQMIAEHAAKERAEDAREQAQHPPERWDQYGRRTAAASATPVLLLTGPAATPRRQLTPAEQNAEIARKYGAAR